PLCAGARAGPRPETQPVAADALAAGRKAAGSTGIKTFPMAGQDHIQPNEQPDNWHAPPPPSGDHLATPLPPGVYDYDQDMRAMVHNEEHGYVVLLYKGIPHDQVEQLRKFGEGRAGC